jgi:hypothetical protein
MVTTRDKYYGVNYIERELWLITLVLLYLTGYNALEREVEPVVRKEFMRLLSKDRFWAVVLFGLGTSCSVALANDVYIAQAAAGSAIGSSCANALVYTYFNNGGNWTSGTPSGTQIGPGTTVHLCGTFTASAGASNYLQFQGSGTSGNPITLIFASGAIIQAPYWSGAAIEMSGSYLIVNGNNTGTIQATANGTGLANAQDNGIGVDSGNGCTNCIIENLTVTNIYVHSCTLPISNCTDEGGQNTYGIRAVTGNNTTITGNTVNNMKWCVFYVYGTSNTGTQISNNTISNCDHGVVFGDQNDSADSGNGSIFGNNISNMNNWDDAGDYNHHDGVHTWANHTGSTYTVLLYSNSLHGNGGANFNTWIGIEAGSNGSTIFNNVVNMQSNCVGGAGLLGLFSGGGPYGGNNAIYNNTIQGNGGSDNCEGIGIQEQTGGTIVKNNIVMNTGTFAYIPASGQVSSIDHNLYYNAANGYWCPSNIEVSFSVWRSGCTYDLNGANSNPSLASGMTPNSGSPAIGLGANLSSLGIAALDTDMAGVTRASTGTCTPGVAGCWDAGAYQYQTSTSSSPTAPTSLVATVQ